MRQFPSQYQLSNSDVLYFSHIPKTAGMTFRTIVEDQFHLDEICPATLNAQLAKMTPAELQPYRLYRGHLGFINLPERVPNKTIVNVTVLREPVSRVISHYEYIRRMPGDPHYPAVKDMTLEEFAQKLTAGKVGKNIQTYHVAKTLQFNLESLKPAEILELAKQSLDQFAFVGLVERFQDSLFLLSYIFGWKPILNNRKENAAKTKPPAEAIPESTIAVIKANTQLDQDLYQYAKEIFEIRYAEMLQGLQAYCSEVGVAAIDPAHPPDHEIMTALLEAHYQARFRMQHPNLGSAAVYDFAQPIGGRGWQRRECPVDAPTYRWSGPEGDFTLDMPIAADGSSDLFVELRLVCTHATPPDRIDSLTLTVNQHTVPILTVASDWGTRTKILQARIPAAFLPGDCPFLPLEFAVNQVAPLNTPTNTGLDTRLVGVAVNLVQVFPVALESELSLLVPLFENQAWQETADFVQAHLQPEDAIASLLAFKLKFANPVYNYTALLDGKVVQWVILHKGITDQLNPLLLKLAIRRFLPIFANDVFVVFTKHSHQPALSYFNPHVKPLYIDPVKRSLFRMVRPLYHRYQQLTKH